MEIKIFDPNTAASTPGALNATRAEYARYRGRSVLGRCYLYLNSFLPIWSTMKMQVGGFRWHHFSEWFQFGDINAATVLSPGRGLVAVYTDLDAWSQKRFPVIKIYRERLRLLPVPAKAGDTFAAVSAYGRGPDSNDTGRWQTFNSIVVDCVRRDSVRCASAKAKISDSDWKALEIGLSQIPDKTRPGLYDIVLPDELKAAL